MKKFPSFHGRAACALVFLGVLLTGSYIVSARRLPHYLKHQGDLHPDAITVSLADFGAVPDGVTDVGPSLQAAIDAVATAGGGTITVPAGTYALITPVAKDFGNTVSSVTLQGQPSTTVLDVAGNGTGLDLSSVFKIQVGTGKNALTFKNINNVFIKDMLFLGVQNVLNDALVVVSFDGVGQANIEHSEFYGLASLNSGGAIVSARETGLKIDQTAFLGCSTSSAVSGSIVQNFLWRDISITNTKFIDYGYRPDFFSKTPLAPPYSWISIGNPTAFNAAASRRQAFLQNLFLDEGGYFGISSIPAYFSPGYPPFEIFVSRIFMNVNNLRSSGIYVDGVNKVMIERSHFGWSHNAGAAVAFFRTGEVTLDQIECVDHADTIIADSQTKITVINSIYQNLQSDPSKTRVIVTPTLADDSVEYVRQQFLNTLGREPDASAYFYWVKKLLDCAGPCTQEIQQDLAEYLAQNPAAKFKISGTVTGEGGLPLAQTTVQLTGTQNVSTQTDAEGKFAFSNLATSGEYTITASKAHYNFSSLSFVEVNADKIANFTGILQRHTISGAVTTSNSTPIVGATLTLSGSGSGSVTTNASGIYSFTNLAGGGNYTITVSHNNYTFQTNAASVTDLSADKTFNFVGSTVNYSISGRITENNVGLSGVTVNLTGGQTLTTTTNDAGNYSFTVPAEANYSVAAAKSGYAFSPASHTFTNLAASQTADFTATRVGVEVKGTVTLGQSGASGIEIQITGSATISTTTDVNGNYSIILPPNGNYTVTPTATHYSFSPPSVQINNLTVLQIANFTMTAVDVVEFANGSYQTSEGVPSVQVSVRRLGNTSAPASIRYSMADGTAHQDQDYILATGVLQFAANETIKSFSVLIVDDGWVESTPETASLKLSDPDGVILGQQAEATLTISDNASPVMNPIEDATTFVQQQYGDFLARPPDGGGLAYWVEQITSCGADQLCVASRRVGVSAAFFVESEFQQTGGFVIRLSRVAVGYQPAYADFMRDRGYLVSFSNLDSAKQQLAEDFSDRQAFRDIYPENLTPTEFIDKLLNSVRVTTGVDLSSQRDALLADYTANSNRGRILRMIADNQELIETEFNRAFVLMQYFGYLRRDPDQGGFDFWFNVLNNREPNNFRGMVCAFLTSREYQERFSPSVPRTDQECAFVR